MFTTPQSETPLFYLSPARLTLAVESTGSAALRLFGTQKSRLFRQTLLLLAVVGLVLSTGLPARCEVEPEDQQLFVSGFDAYQQKDYTASLKMLKELLAKYPDTPLRDVALFWLSRSYYRAGNMVESARYKAQFSREYPDNLLNEMIDDRPAKNSGRRLASTKQPGTANQIQR